MNISKISAFTKTNPAFSGLFKEVSRRTDENFEQRYNLTTVHSVYYPNKNESEKEIREAMRAYGLKTESSPRGFIPDGGMDSNGCPTMTQAWTRETVYSCERGERLPF